MSDWSVHQIEGTNIYTVEIRPEMGPGVINEIYNYFIKMPADQKIRLLGIFLDFEDFIGVKDFVQGISMNEIQIKRLEKYALMSNQRWFERILEFEDKLFHGIDFKAFNLNQKEEAIEWLAS